MFDHSEAIVSCVVHPGMTDKIAIVQYGAKNVSRILMQLRPA